jgi:subtilisin family serine protease
MWIVGGVKLKVLVIVAAVSLAASSATAVGASRNDDQGRGGTNAGKNGSKATTETTQMSNAGVGRGGGASGNATNDASARVGASGSGGESEGNGADRGAGAARGSGATPSGSSDRGAGSTNGASVKDRKKLPGNSVMLIVRFAPGINSANEAASIARTSKGRVDRTFSKVLNGAVIELPENAVAALRRNPRVLSVEEDVDVLVDPTTSTVQSNATWGLDRIDQRALPLSGTYTAPSSASSVTAYVVDTGVDAAHSEFAGRVASGFDAVAGTDGRSDCNGHGTHVAGTIAGSVYGVAKSARVVPVRVLDCTGSGSVSGVIAGLDWIAKNRPAGQRAVVNMSLGTSGIVSSLDSAVASLVSTGVSVVVAAGNSNVDACTSSPARVASAITVGATTTADARASFSNFGTCLDLFAPGANITSAKAGGGATTFSGTSMAAPHVAGVAALLLETAALSANDVANRLAAEATSDVVTSAGSGSANRLLFVTPSNNSGDVAPPPAPVEVTVPDQPAAPSVSGRNRAITVAWSLPADGGSPIVAQTVRVYRGDSVVVTLRTDGVTTALRVGRLTNGVEYTATVTASNSVGAGPESQRSAVVIPSR